MLQLRIKPFTDQKRLNDLPFRKSLIKKAIIKPFNNRKLLSEIIFYKRFLEEPKYYKLLKSF